MIDGAVAGGGPPLDAERMRGGQVADAPAALAAKRWMVRSFTSVMVYDDGERRVRPGLGLDVAAGQRR